MHAARSARICPPSRSVRRRRDPDVVLVETATAWELRVGRIVFATGERTVSREAFLAWFGAESLLSSAEIAGGGEA